MGQTVRQSDECRGEEQGKTLPEIGAGLYVSKDSY